VSGVVREIGLFATQIDTPDNVRTFVGNSKIFGDTIQNYATNPHRRVDLELNAAGTLLAVRPSRHDDHYWDVYFAANEAIVAELSTAGYPVPAQALALVGHVVPPAVTSNPRAAAS
jgi:small conductance mechanosensitive channel